MNLNTQNYLVIGVVVAAFAVILPIFLRPYFSTPASTPNVNNQFNNRPRSRGERSGGPGKGHPAMDSMRDFHSMHGGRPPMGGPPHPGMNDMGGEKQGGGGGRGGIMSIALPIYSVGIVLYVLYVFYKFYTKGFSGQSDQNRKCGPGGNNRTAPSAAKPTVEQIQNYKQFLLAKEECARRISEERELQSSGSSPKLSGDQLTQLEARLREAEDAMERAMVKMGLDVRQLKQDTGYQDPLAQSLEELKKTMATLSSNDPTVSLATEATASNTSQQSAAKESPAASPAAKTQQMSEQSPKKSALKLSKELDSEVTVKVNDVSFKDDLEEIEIGSKVTEGSSLGDGESENENGESGHDTMDVSVAATKARRVSFAESVDVIKRESCSGLSESDVAGGPSLTSTSSVDYSTGSTSASGCKEPEIIGVLPEPDPNHPANEPEGVYLKHPVFEDGDVVNSPSNDNE